MNEIIVGLINLAILLILFLTGIELAFCMAIMGFIGFAYLVSFPAAFDLMAKDYYDALASYGFTVIPLFIFMGQIAFNAGIAKKLFEAAHRFVGHIPGGLAIATVAGATIFKAICGSSTATAATFASVAVPEMDRYGYDKRLSTGIVSTVGTLGCLIPPSVTLIVFGVITEQSIGRLFMAGLVPGLLIAFFFVVIIVGWAKMNPVIAPRSEKYSWGARVTTLPEVMWPVLIFLVVIGGLLKGFFTPSEAGSVGCSAVIILALLKRGLGWKELFKSVDESLRTACMVLMLIAGSAVLGHFIAVTNIPMIAAKWIAALPLPHWLIMIIIMLFYELGGSFIDDLAFMILATPIFFPAVIKLGYDPMWFGMMIMITVMVGVVIPPVAINVFVVKNITKTPFSVIYAGVYPFLMSLVFMGILLFIFPQICTFLPNLLYK
jgi:tripartite ATP-independent transporter DctM subunit